MATFNLQKPSLLLKVLSFIYLLKFICVLLIDIVMLWHFSHNNGCI